MLVTRRKVLGGLSMGMGGLGLGNLLSAQESAQEPVPRTPVARKVSHHVDISMRDFSDQRASLQCPSALQVRTDLMDTLDAITDSKDAIEAVSEALEALYPGKVVDETATTHYKSVWCREEGWKTVCCELVDFGIALDDGVVAVVVEEGTQLE